MSIASPFTLSAQQKKAVFHHIPSKETVVKEDVVNKESILPQIDSTKIIVRDVDEIIASLGQPDFKPVLVNKAVGPWIFLGFRNVAKNSFDEYSCSAYVPAGCGDEARYTG